MKKLSWLTIFAVFLFAGSAFAYPKVDLQYVEVASRVDGDFHFPHLGNLGGVETGQYILKVNGVEIGGFCVEDAYSNTAKLQYDLVKPSETPFNNVANVYVYKQAAWLFQNFGGNAPATQVAIWEAVMDPGNYDLSSGLFYVNSYNSALLADAVNYIKALKDLGAGVNPMDFDGSYRIAWNPSDSEFNTLDAQNFIIPTPEPGIIMLLGLGLIGVVAMRKKN